MLILKRVLHISKGRRAEAKGRVVLVVSSCRHYFTERGAVGVGLRSLQIQNASTMSRVSSTQQPITVGWEVTSLIMSLYGVKFHIGSIMLKTPVRRVQRDYWPLSLLVIVISASVHSCLCRRRTLNEFSLVCERDFFETLFAHFPNSQPMTLISCSSWPVVAVGTHRKWFTRPNGPLSAWTGCLSFHHANVHVQPELTTLYYFH